MRDCDPEVYAQGHLVMMTHTITAGALEEWVQQVAARSGQRVDWHYAAGRSCILALGELAPVYAALEELLPEHDELQRQAAEAMSPYTETRPFRPSSVLYAENEINTMHEYLRQGVVERRSQQQAPNAE